MQKFKKIKLIEKDKWPYPLKKILLNRLFEEKYNFWEQRQFVLPFIFIKEKSKSISSKTIRRLISTFGCRYSDCKRKGSLSFCSLHKRSGHWRTLLMHSAMEQVKSILFRLPLLPHKKKSPVGKVNQEQKPTPGGPRRRKKNKICLKFANVHTG